MRLISPIMISLLLAACTTTSTGKGSGNGTGADSGDSSPQNALPAGCRRDTTKDVECSDQSLAPYGYICSSSEKGKAGTYLCDSTIINSVEYWCCNQSSPFGS